MKNQNAKSNGSKKSAAIVTAGVGAGVLLGAGALALFSDNSKTETGATAGTVSVSVVTPDISNSTNINPGDNDPYTWAPTWEEDERHYIPTIEDPLFDPESDADPSKEDSYVLVSTTKHDLSFTVANTGTKSIRTRQTMLLSVYQTDEDGKVEYLDANVFSLHEDGTYLGTKSLDITTAAEAPLYDSSALNKSPYADEYASVKGQADVSSVQAAGTIAANYEKSLQDGLTQPWEELCYKYYIDDNGKEYLMSIPAFASDVIATDYQVINGNKVSEKELEGYVTNPADIADLNITAVKYVTYSDIFDGVTDDMSVMDAEIENEDKSGTSNLGDGDNINVIPEAYHVTSKVVDKAIVNSAIIGTGEKAFYKDQNSNMQYALAVDNGACQLFYHDTEFGHLIAGEEMTIAGVKYEAGDYILADGKGSFANFTVSADGTISVGDKLADLGIGATTLFPVEINTEFDDNGDIVFDFKHDANGDDIAGTFAPVVHAYNAKEYSYMLAMDKDSTNKYQGATLAVNVVVEAMQYRNTNGLADWKMISTNTLETALDFGDEAVQEHTNIVVPAKDEEPITTDELTQTIDNDAYVAEDQVPAQHMPM